MDEETKLEIKRWVGTLLFLLFLYGNITVHNTNKRRLSSPVDERKTLPANLAKQSSVEQKREAFIDMSQRMTSVEGHQCIDIIVPDSEYKKRTVKLCPLPQ